MKNMKNMNGWLPALVLAAGLALSLPLAAQAQCGGGSGGSMDHNSHMGSSGMMGNTGNMGMGSSGHTGQGAMGPGMRDNSGAPSGAWAPPAAPANAGPGQMGHTGAMDHSQMGHGPSGTGQ